jgi:hypothetical protein
MIGVTPIQKGDIVCYKGNRREIAAVGKIDTLDYGAGRIITKVMVIWITGSRIGKKQMYDVRDLVRVEK